MYFDNENEDIESFPEYSKQLLLFVPSGDIRVRRLMA